jgi:hypothetical protein
MASADTDFYSDDPVQVSDSPSKKKLSSILAFLLLLVGGTYLVQTTLAANIALNTGAPIEFGQGITATAACSGATDLTITPNSTFTNSSGAGAFYFSSVTVSNIPTSCYGVDFTINAYDNTSSTPLALFNSTSTSAVVYNNAGTFSAGNGSTGMTVSSGSGTFTATFNVPVAQSSNVFKLTIQSGAHTPPTVYSVGNVGPGGGLIYSVNLAGFSCGATYTNTGSPTGGKCNYLEVAPSGWNTGSDPAKPWATGTLSSGNAILDIATIPNRSAQNRNELSQIGLGYKYSIDIVTQNGLYNESSNNYAAGAARAYTGGSKSDWYLPTASELNQLCRWARGVAPSETNYCTGGSINSATYGASSAGFEATEYYWSSNEYTTAGMANIQSFSINGQYSQATNSKNTAYWVRPIRAF